MRQWLLWLNMFLEFIWNKTTVLQYPIRYKMRVMGANRVVTQWIKVGERDRKFIFVSQQISYLRVGRWLKRKARQYKVEVIYRYLTNNIGFVEEHTGLSDVMVEYDILRTAMKSGKKYREKLKSPIWKILKDFAIEKGVI